MNGQRYSYKFVSHYTGVGSNCGWRPTPMSLRTVTFILQLINSGLTNCPVTPPSTEYGVGWAFFVGGQLKKPQREKKARVKEIETIWVIPPFFSIALLLLRGPRSLLSPMKASGFGPLY